MDRSSLTPTEFASAVGAITSAFGDPTRRSIYLYARDADESVTASDVARHFDLHPNVARHHLDKLAAGGYLDIEVGRSGHAGAGRPSKHYRATTKDVTLEFPVHHDDLLVTLLAKTIALLPSGAVEQMAEEVGAEYGRAMAASLGDPGEHQQTFR
ncbi:MAG: helix-turn-helix domain-containing protein [Acidimicrobiia bacterium]|nr:helix-turn-helix domain-containing protein [Acidimicrobiia bacterium]